MPGPKRGIGGWPDARKALGKVQTASSGPFGWSWENPAQPQNPLRPTGALYETYPRGYATGDMSANNACLATDQVFMWAIPLPNALTITSITFLSANTALGTGTHQYFGLYDSSLNLLRATNDDTSTAWGANTTKTLNLTSTYTTTYSGLYYLAILIEATTVPSLTVSSHSLTNVYGLSPVLQGRSNTGVATLQNPAAALVISALNQVRAYAYVS